MNINVNPSCLGKMRGEDITLVLENVMTIMKVGKSAIEILKNINFNEDPEYVVDYGDLFDLEDLLIEKESSFTGFGVIDPQDIVKYGKNACFYFNEACELLDVDSCSNTLMDCAEMLCKIQFAVANASAFIYNILSEVIPYTQYLKNVSDPNLEEQTKLQYPEYENVEISYSPEILNVLSKECVPDDPNSMIEFVAELLNTVREFPTQGTMVLSRYSEYSEFYEIIDRYNEVEIQDATRILMPHDVSYILSVAHNDPSLLETELAKLGDKLEGRMGAIDGVQSISYYGLDSLVWLSKYCKTESDCAALFENERLILSDLNKCYLSIARQNLYSLNFNGSPSSMTNYF